MRISDVPNNHKVLGKHPGEQADCEITQVGGARGAGASNYVQ